MPELTSEQLNLGLAVVGALALIAFLLAAILAFRLRKLRRDYVIVRGGVQERDILDAFGQLMTELQALNSRVDGIVAVQQEQAAIGRLALQNFAVVRYDAFDDMGGRLSFSAALLDDHGDGMVITSINGRSDSRTYAKPIQGLTSQHNLSEEEREAITGAAARRGKDASRAVVSR